MMRPTFTVAFALLLSLAAPARAQISATLVASGLAEPLYLAQPAGDPRLFVIERGGTMRILEGGVVQATPFLDLSAKISNPFGGEGGLLGLVFAPDYATSGVFYVYYTGHSATSAVDMQSVVSRFTVPGDPLTATSVDAGLETPIFTLDQPYTNHNGGTLAIRNGWLYLGLGDGGGSGDPEDRAQVDASPFGKMLRLDLSIASPTTDDWRVFAKGLRNPYRYSFDRATGDLYIGDVGQATEEEIDAVPADAIDAVLPDAGPGFNFGWDVMEGALCFDDPFDMPPGPDPSEPLCNDPGFTDPIHVYDHLDGLPGAVVGGAVYRGSASPAMRGDYFFADWALSLLFRLRWSAAGGLETFEEITGIPVDAGQILQPVAITEDAAGELYIVGRFGQIHRLVPEPGAAAGSIAAIAALVWCRRHARS